MLVLMTGGSGFIGTHLRKELNDKGYDIIVYDRKKPCNQFDKYVKGDVRDYDNLKNAARDCQIIYHLGGLIGTEYLTHFVRDAVEINVLGTINVFEVAKSLNIKVINSGVIPNWLNPYMLTKKSVSRFGKMYFELFGTEVVTLELTHVYGPGQAVKPYYKAIPTFINKAIQNKPIEIFGDGNRLMDCLFVKDAVHCVRLAGEKKDVGGLIISVSSGYSISVLDLAKKIIRITNSKSELQFNKMRLGEPNEIHKKESNICVSHASDLFEWNATVDLNEGLQSSVEWYSKRRHNL
jgi:UDP-glucose 4-epimerase